MVHTEHELLMVIAYKLEADAEVLAGMGFNLDASHLRASSARLREHAGHNERGQEKTDVDEL